MYIAKNKVRMHDTDMAGILYFPRQFRFVHDALEDFMESEDLEFDKVFHIENFVFVIVHCEADYYAPLTVGDKLEVKLYCEHMGTSSFTMRYLIYKIDGQEVGAARTVHVSLERRSRKKIPLPERLKSILSKHLQ